jgi:hypothetical protein
MKAFKRITSIIIILILGVCIGIYKDSLIGFFKNLGKKNGATEATLPVLNTVQNKKRALPSGFSAGGLIEKKLDLNNDGVDELLLATLSSSGPKAALVDPKDNSKLLSNIFAFPQKGFSDEYTFKSKEAPEISQTLDLNKDGRDELIFELKDYGAYTSTFGIVSYDGKKMNWVILENKDGTMRPAIFRDGASVRNASVFKIDENANRSIAEVLGAGDDNGNWTWVVSAYKWNGTKYLYDASLSAKIFAEQPKKIVNGQPVF